MDVCWEQERKKYIFATTISFLPWCLSKFLDFQCFIYFFSKMRLIKPSSKLRRVVACFYRALSKPKILQRVRKHLITFRFRKTLIFNYSVVWYATINFLSLEADHLYIFTLRSVGFSRSYFFSFNRNSQESMGWSCFSLRQILLYFPGLSQLQ